VSVCLSVCPHDKTKTAETEIAKLGTQSITIPCPPFNIGSEVKFTGSHSVQALLLAARIFEQPRSMPAWLLTLPPIMLVGVSNTPLSSAPLVTSSEFSLLNVLFNCETTFLSAFRSVVGLITVYVNILFIIISVIESKDTEPVSLE